MSKSKAEAKARRVRLTEEVLANLSDEEIDHLAWILAKAYLSGQTPQEAAVDAVAYIGQCAPIPDAGPTPADMLERSGLGLLPFFSMELGPEFSESGPTDSGKEV